MAKHPGLDIQESFPSYRVGQLGGIATKSYESAPQFSMEVALLNRGSYELNTQSDRPLKEFRDSIMLHK